MELIIRIPLEPNDDSLEEANLEEFVEGSKREDCLWLDVQLTFGIREGWQYHVGAGEFSAEIVK